MIEAIPLHDKKLIVVTESRLHWQLPEEMKEYYLNFGGTDSCDFMYNLYPLQDFVYLSESDWEFVSLEYSNAELNKYIVFAESPANDPLCINEETFEIVLFSHDPLKYGKVYNNFGDFLINEIISVQEQLGELDFETDEKSKLMAELLQGTNIDYEFRHLKLE